MKFVGLLIAGVFLGGAALGQGTMPVRYLAFQIFTGSADSTELRRNFPPAPSNLVTAVMDLRNRIGVSSAARKLAFIAGPLSFDQSDEQVRRTIGSSFDAALTSGVAVGFHLDDSMFWGRLKELNTPENLEWLDWNRTANTGRRLDWSATPTKIMPQLCLNSEAVKAAVSMRAALVAAEIGKGLRRLHAAGRSDLFAGVIAGWETQIGRDFDTGRYAGYCALTHAGFSAAKPPADPDAELSRIVREFVELWARSLIAGGVPQGKVYSHIAFQSEAAYQASRSSSAVPYLRAIHWSPPAAAFCESCIPGLSTYPQPGHLEQWRAELDKHGNPPWISAEGTAIDPGAPGQAGMVNMEGYLGSLFNHGAILVNLFGWGVGDAGNPFRKAAEGAESLSAYRKFLNGEKLAESNPQTPSGELPAKIHQIQNALPAWVKTHGAQRVRPLMDQLDAALKAKRFDEASRTADSILRLIGQ